MRIGLDFDNTIVCYDQAFYRVALEKNWIPQDLLQTKESVKKYLVDLGKNDLWTILQGIVYGPCMNEASVFPGFEQFLNQTHALGHQVFIVSHRSPRPYAGGDFDLHQAAKDWLKNKPWIQSGKIQSENIYFEPTKIGKIERINSLSLDVFVDDLEEILTHPNLDLKIKKIHFMPDQARTTWHTMLSLVTG